MSNYEFKIGDIVFCNYGFPHYHGYIGKIIEIFEIYAKEYFKKVRFIDGQWDVFSDISIRHATKEEKIQYTLKQLSGEWAFSKEVRCATKQEKIIYTLKQLEED